MPPKIGCATTEPSKVSTDFLALGVFAGNAGPKLSPSFDALCESLGGTLPSIADSRDFAGTTDQKFELDTLGCIPARRLFFFGLGNADDLTPARLRGFAAQAARAANVAKARSLAIATPFKVDASGARALAEGIALGSYRFTKYLTGDRKPKNEITTATVLAKGKLDATKKAVDLGLRIGACICHARDIVNEPANELTPAALAADARKMARSHNLTCAVFNRNALEQMGMNLLLAVARGSANEPCLIHLKYTPASESEKRLVIVGKGLTFDSGGLCIKQANSMSDMKCDMAGAANVIGFMEAVSVLAPDVEVHGVIGAAENMPDGNAYRPGDIVRSLIGKTVEVVNTDAEGRLVLADALAYARKLEPTLLLCNATLTGACVVALGQRCSAYYSTDEQWATEFAEAAKESGEQFWRLPLLEDMRERLKSNVADLKHTGDRWGGSISAALFLTEFVGDVPFIHCDIAGTAFTEKPYGIYPKGATGHGVLALLQFLERF